MNQLCLFTNLTSAEWAAWVQAVGSVAAVAAAIWIASAQSSRQHKTSMQVLREEHRLARIELARTLLALSMNCQKLVKHITGQMPDRSTIHRIATGEAHLDLRELRILESAVDGIPLHSLPHTLVSFTMILGSTIRQFREKVEAALHFHREMDAKAFEKFFEMLGQMNRSLAATCEDISNEVKRSSEEA